MEISWRTTEAGFVLEWRESGGPKVVPPVRRGFGSKLLKRALAADFSAHIEFDPAGVTCAIEGRLPAENDRVGDDVEL